MNDIPTQLFGSSSDLNVLQMVLRGVLVFALTLLMYRISGRRSLGQHSLFDVCVTVLLGAILSRAVVGASPFLPTIATGFALVLFHRAIAHVSARSESFSTLVNGRPRTLVQDGRPDRQAMRKALVSDEDLEQALRNHGLLELREIRRMVLERNGAISVVAQPRRS